MDEIYFHNVGDTVLWGLYASDAKTGVVIDRRTYWSISLQKDLDEYLVQFEDGNVWISRAGLIPNWVVA